STPDMHECSVHGCSYVTNRRWNIYMHLARRHQYPSNLIDSMKKIEEDGRARHRKALQEKMDLSFKCEQCGLAYPNRKRLNEHIRRKHPDKVDNSKSAQVVCAFPDCSFVCRSREKLADHCAEEHATDDCPYLVQSIWFNNENEYLGWKIELETETDSEFATNSAYAVSNSNERRVYMWCARANKVRSKPPKPDSERKRFGNYHGRTKRVQSHCSAFITAWYLPDGRVSVKFCRDHVGHNSPQQPTRGAKRKREAAACKTPFKKARVAAQSSQHAVIIDKDESDDLDSDDDDGEYIDVGEQIDHEEYVEDEEEELDVEESGHYCDEDEEHEGGEEGEYVEEMKMEMKPTIRYLTASDRMRPHLNPSYNVEPDIVEEEHETEMGPSTSGRYRQDSERMRAVPMRSRSQEGVKEEADLTMVLLRESRRRVLHARRSEKERGQIEKFNSDLQTAMKQLESPVRGVGERRRIKSEMASPGKMPLTAPLYDPHDPDDVVHEEEVTEEGVEYGGPTTSYDVHDYYR
ncbi:hypothetical protein PFISCL1PPCAC_7772, partial [Pristionchus fissidentatus]